jgi:hypothetical protein
VEIKIRRIFPVTEGNWLAWLEPGFALPPGAAEPHGGNRFGCDFALTRRIE